MIETLERPAVAEPVSPIKPSEALRLGRLTHPNRPPEPTYVDDPNCAACAVGKIAVGFGWRAADGNPWDYVEDRLGWDLTSDIEDRYEGLSPDEVVVTKWSDDQIVTWLEARGL